MLVRVLQTLQMSIFGGKLARLLVPRTPVARARTSNTPNVHSGRLSCTCFTFQGHPFSCAYFKHSKCPFQAALAHVPPVPRTPVLVRVLQHSNCPFSAASRTSPRPKDTRCSCAYFKHSKCPYLAALSQFSSNTPCSCAYFKHPVLPAARAVCSFQGHPSRARTSNTPDFHSWRHNAHVHSSHGAPCSRANFIQS